MTNPTNPFNWQMPTASDLVTDLPADFEVFGQAVATSMADLLGGTSGQILAKNSNTDMDFVWVTNDVGDITAVTAGTGISGGGTSGAVTITNSMATEITAKGDLIAGTGSATFDNLPVGTNGQTLVADSSTATGLKWATASSSPTFVGAKIYNTVNQSISTGTWTSITFNSEYFDTDAFHSTSTNTSRMTIPTGKGGKYLVTSHLEFTPAASGDRRIGLAVNGTRVQYLIFTPSSSNQTAMVYSTTFDIAAGNYFELQVYQNSGGAVNVEGGSDLMDFTITYLGA